MVWLRELQRYKFFGRERDQVCLFQAATGQGERERRRKREREREAEKERGRERERESGIVICD